jgi:hypothetical protein
MKLFVAVVMLIAVDLAVIFEGVVASMVLAAAVLVIDSRPSVSLIVVAVTLAIVHRSDVVAVPPRCGQMYVPTCAE